MSGWYLAGKEALLSRSIPAEAGVYALGVNESYVYDPSHSNFAVLTPHILLPEKQLTGLSFANGVLTAADARWEGAGAGIEDRSLVLRGIIIYFMLAEEGALLAYIDSAPIGLPQTLQGGSVTAKWSSQGILRL